jgi:small redox-active disulfide protein 2
MVASAIIGWSTRPTGSWSFDMKIEILGTGCPKCSKLAENAAAAAAQLGLQVELTKVTDIVEITQHGVMMTPALVIDGQVKAVGKVPSVAEIVTMLVAAGAPEESR